MASVPSIGPGASSQNAQRQPTASARNAATAAGVAAKRSGELRQQPPLTFGAANAALAAGPITHAQRQIAETADTGVFVIVGPTNHQDNETAVTNDT
ncbi:hypothetical protein [Micromonospora maris]|uniref:hypothetical protein n=1 Tax=Micromonospora maris TaxID=1003110 RepID=UPI001389B21B|nr:hypothetical protein [Micromonospora maris]